MSNIASYSYRTLNALSIVSMTACAYPFNGAYIAIYIRNKMSFVYIRKIIFLYCIYSCYSFA
jgi:hypothetical protein